MAFHATHTSHSRNARQCVRACASTSVQSTAHVCQIRFSSPHTYRHAETAFDTITQSTKLKPIVDKVETLIIRALTLSPFHAFARKCTVSCVLVSKFECNVSKISIIKLMRGFMCPGVEIRMQRVENKHNKRNAGDWGPFFFGSSGGN